MDEVLDTVPRPRAVIHVALATAPAPLAVGEQPAGDRFAAIFAALIEAGRLAGRRFDDIYAQAPPLVRLIVDAATPPEAPPLGLARGQGLDVVVTARSAEDIIEDCDCLLVAGDAAASSDLCAPALSRGRPVTLTAPRAAEPILLVPLPDESGLDATLANASRSEPLTPQNLLAYLLTPPARDRGRERLASYLAEGVPRGTSRVEYDLLMRLLGPPSGRRRAPSPEPWSSACAILGEEAGWVAELERHYDIADGLALDYGEKWRSALVTRSFLLLVSIVVLGLIGVVNADLSLVTMPLQLVITGFIFVDRWRAIRGQWQRRWLEYRMLAERLRCLRYLRLAGIADAEGARRQPDEWTAWYGTRVARRIGPCRDPDPAKAGAVLEHLLAAEIGEQITYHRSAIRRYAGLDLRTRRVSRNLLALTVTLGVATLAASYEYPHLLSWSGIAGLAFSAAPAIVTGLNAFRAELDLMRLTERSARIQRGLEALARAARARVASQGATTGLARAVAWRAASLMLDEVSQWRFVLEARSARLKRH